MKRICFESYEDFIFAVENKFVEIRKDDPYNDISIVAKYEETQKIMRWLSEFGYYPCCIDFHEPGYEGYRDEYIISLVNLNGYDEFFCEPMRRDDHYITDESSVIYILDNCSCKVISHCEGDEVFEVCIEDDDWDDWDDDECEECCCSECVSKDTNECESTYVSKDENGVPVGFSKSWSTTENGVNCYSSYSHYSDDLDMLKEIAEKFGVRL